MTISHLAYILILPNTGSDKYLDVSFPKRLHDFNSKCSEFTSSALGFVEIGTSKTQTIKYPTPSLRGKDLTFMRSQISPMSVTLLFDIK